MTPTPLWRVENMTTPTPCPPRNHGTHASQPAASIHKSATPFLDVAQKQLSVSGDWSGFKQGCRLLVLAECREVFVETQQCGGPQGSPADFRFLL